MPGESERLTRVAIGLERKYPRRPLRPQSEADVEMGDVVVVVQIKEKGQEELIVEHLDSKDVLSLALWRIAHVDDGAEAREDSTFTAESVARHFRKTNGKTISPQTVRDWLKKGIADLGILLEIQKMTRIDHMLLYACRARAKERKYTLPGPMRIRPKRV